MSIFPCLFTHYNNYPELHILEICKRFVICSHTPYIIKLASEIQQGLPQSKKWTCNQTLEL